MTATSIKVKVEKLDLIDLSHDSDEGDQSGAGVYHILSCCAR